MSEYRQIFDSSNKEEEAESMNEIPSSPAFSMTSESTDIPDSEIIDQTVEDVDELMYLEVLSEDEEVTWLGPQSTNKESGISSPTHWCASPVPDTSETIAPLDQTLVEVISEVCRSYLFPENLETEADDSGEEEEAWASEALSRTEDSNAPTQSDLSSSPLRLVEEEEDVIPEEIEGCHSPDEELEVNWWRVEMGQCSQSQSQLLVTDEVNSVLSVALQASLDGESSSITVATKDRAAKKTLEGAVIAMKSFFTGQSTAVKRIRGLAHDSKEKTQHGGCKIKRKKLQWKRCFSGRQRNRIQPAPLEHLNEAVRSASADLTSRSTEESKQGSLCSQETPSTTSGSATLGADLRSTQLELVDYVEDEDQAPEDTRDVVSSLSSSSLISSDKQVFEVTRSKWFEDPHLVEAKTDEFHEQVSTYQSSVDQFQPDAECVSNNQADAEVAKTKRSNRFFRFLTNIFSKNEKKKEKNRQLRITPSSLLCGCGWCATVHTA